MGEFINAFVGAVGQGVGYGLGGGKKAEQLIAECEKDYKASVMETARVQQELNAAVEQFKTFWCKAIDDTVVLFREYLENAGQTINDKEYRLKSGNVMASIQEIKNIEQRLCHYEGKNSFSDIAAAYSAEGRTKTGYALMAAGAAIEGFSQGQKAMSKAQEYAEKIDNAISKMKGSRIAMTTYKNHIKELQNILLGVVKMAVERLELLEPLIPDFRDDDEYSLDIFSECAELVKRIGTLAQMPLIDKKQNISPECIKIVGFIKSKTNKR